MVTKEQQEDLDPVLGRAFLLGGKEFGDLVMAAYKIGRRHGPGREVSGAWIPADPDGLPPHTYPQWRKQEMARREEER